MIAGCIAALKIGFILIGVGMAGKIIIRAL